MHIKKKNDINVVLDSFTSYAHWDASGQKHYLVFMDRKRGGQWTLMYYPGEHFSIHGTGTDYSDDNESFFYELDSITAFLWENRSAFNAAIKQVS